jgi:tetratricopeptide (TPR) repeat protein
MKVSLAMIVLNAKEGIVRCLASVQEAMDEIVIVDTGSTDGTQDAIRDACPKARIIEWIDPERHTERGWISDFAKARNMAFDATTGDAILWLDADDVVAHKDPTVNPAVDLRSKIEQALGPQGGCEIMEMLYDYKKDAYGHTIMYLPRYRVIRRGAMRWAWPVHEDLRPEKFLKKADLRKDPLYINHLKPESGERESAERNLWIMQKYLDGGGEMDARLWSNFGGSYRALGENEKAVETYDKALEFRGIDPEADYLCWIRSGDSSRWLKRYDEAVRRYLQAQVLFPFRKAAYVALGDVLIEMDRPTEALAYVDIADGINGTDEGFVWLDEATRYIPTSVRANAQLKLHNYSESLAHFDELAKRYPGNKEFVQKAHDIRSMLEATRDYGAWVRVSQMLPEGERKPLLSKAPESLWTHGLVAKARKPERPEDKPVMAIYCGGSREPWGPFSVDEGIGGSEEAVIFLAREMARLGWYVEVYGFPPKDQIGLVHDGVCWMPFFAWGEDEPADVFVGWRQMRPKQAFDAGLGGTSGQRWLWLHDAVIPEFFRMPWVERVNGVFCLSEFHAQPVSGVLNGKIVQTKNGLDPTYLVDGENDPKQFIYASSPDRGMDCVLEEWPKIREAIPGAILHLYYGFTGNYIASMAGNAKLRDLKVKIEALREQEGVVWHGMVGQLELAQAFADCGFWIYPTAWPETSCAAAGTLVQLPCDRSKHPYGIPIEELVGKENFPVYSYDPAEERFVLANCTKVWETGVDRECVDIELDDGSILTLTPDHKVMDFDGEWHEAATLTPGMRLNALHMRYNVGYKDVDGDWRDEHRLVGEWQKGRPLTTKECVDHLELTRLDNRPEMLRVMSLSEHSRHTHSTKGPRRKKSMEKQIAGFKAWAATTEAKEHFKTHLGGAGKALWAKIRALPEAERKAWMAARASKRVASQRANAEANGGRWNHKVVAVRPSARRHTVYDMEVDRLHNFVAGGVVIHNCITGMKAQALGCIPVTSRYGRSGVPETVKYDLGPEPRDSIIYGDAAWRSEWTDAVIAAARRQDLGPYRQEMKSWARETYSWSKVAKQWDALFRAPSSEPSPSMARQPSLTG